jgi:cullin 3
MGAIYSKSASTLSFEELYRAGYNLVTKKHGDRLYKGVERTLSGFLDRWATERIVPIFVRENTVKDEGNDNHGEDSDEQAMMTFLTSVESVWRDHVVAAAMVRDVLLYLVRISYFYTYFYLFTYLLIFLFIYTSLLPFLFVV